MKNYYHVLNCAYDIFLKYMFESKRRIENYNAEMIITYICDKYDIEIDSFSFKNNDFCGMIIPDEHETTIVYNKEHIPARRNFTLSHEIGHFFLHKDVQSEFADRIQNLNSKIIDPIEQEANVFAAHILLPDPILKLLLDNSVSFAGIAKKMHISYECTFWRIVHFSMTYLKHSWSESFQLATEYKTASLNGLKMHLTPVSKDRNKSTDISNSLIYK